MRQRRSLILSLFIIVLIAATYNFLDTKFSWSDSKGFGQTTLRVPSGEMTFVTHIEVPPVQEESKYHCDEILLDRMAGGCDHKCLIQAVANKDPELANFIIESTTGKLPYTSRLSKFYAIALYQNEDSDKEKESILRSLVTEDPRNAFPALLLASWFIEQGRRAEGLTFIQDALSRPDYINYISDFQKRLKRLTIHNEQQFAAAIRFIQGKMPVTMMVLSLNGLDDDTKFAVGKKIVERTVAFEGKGALLNYSPLDYDLGKMWIAEVDPDYLNDLEGVNKIVEHEMRSSPHLLNFDCEEQKFSEYRLSEKERIFGVK